jgi:hypothetical protein
VALFVHLTPAENAKPILRAGIRCSPDRHGRIVFAMPVTRNFFVTHQWLRELKRRGARTLVAVYFRIPDEEAVLAGRYNGPHTRAPAARAAAILESARDPLGFEVHIPRAIRPSEIHRVRHVPQVLGWRYFPGAHGVRPLGCPDCQRGEYGARAIRARYEASFG